MRAKFNSRSIATNTPRGKMNGVKRPLSDQSSPTKDTIQEASGAGQAEPSESQATDGPTLDYEAKPPLPKTPISLILFRVAWALSTILVVNAAIMGISQVIPRWYVFIGIAVAVQLVVGVFWRRAERRFDREWARIAALR